MILAKLEAVKGAAKGRGGGEQEVSGEKGARGRNREVSFCIVNNTLKTHK